MAAKVIGVADCGVSADVNDSMTTFALGSCIAVTLHDPVAKVGGMLHFLLPDCTFMTDRGRLNPYVYGDTGVSELVRRCVQLGAQARRMRVYAAGGSTLVKDDGFFDVGRRNYSSLLQVLSKSGLRLHADSVGGSCWRSMRLEIGTGKVWVKEGEKPELELSCVQ